MLAGKAQGRKWEDLSPRIDSISISCVMLHVVETIRVHPCLHSHLLPGPEAGLHFPASLAVSNRSGPSEREQRWCMPPSVLAKKRHFIYNPHSLFSIHYLIKTLQEPIGQQSHKIGAAWSQTYWMKHSTLPTLTEMESGRNTEQLHWHSGDVCYKITLLWLIHVASHSLYLSPRYLICKAGLLHATCLIFVERWLWY